MVFYEFILKQVGIDLLPLISLSNIDVYGMQLIIICSNHNEQRAML